MTRLKKIAFVSPVWTTWQHRMMAGALRYADTHARLNIRGFAPVKNLAAAAVEVEVWGADGILGFFEHEDQLQFLQALKKPIPLVNGALAKDHPGVLNVVADFKFFVETAVNHFRQLGLRSMAILVLEEGPQIRQHLVSTFTRVANLSAANRSSLICAVDRELLWNPQLPMKAVPAILKKWLQQLPKPVGILTPELGGGGYLIRCCKAIGLKVPDDVAVIGGDDTDLSLAVEPTLTSVLPALETIGFEAARLLVDLVDGIRPASSIIRLRCADLHVRESTGMRRPAICDIAGALQFIGQNACRNITVQQVIKQTQRVSKVTFHKRFKEATGKSPAEVIRDRKLDEVRRLLTASDLPLAMVSDLCGFSSANVLARVFRSAEGMSPRDFRKSVQKKQPMSSKAQAGAVRKNLLRR